MIQRIQCQSRFMSKVCHLWKVFDVNSVLVERYCGFEGENTARIFSILWFPQRILSIRNIFDKPLYALISFFGSFYFYFYFGAELIRFHIFSNGSVFGITVLPVTLGAYRYKTLQNDSTGEGLLQKYFLSESRVISLFCFV